MYMGVKEGSLGLSEVEKLTSQARACVAGPGSVRPEGTYYVAVEPNSFGIPSVGTCPGKTTYCEQDCYAIEAERRTLTGIKMQRNLDILEEAETVDGMAAKLRELIVAYKERADRLNIPPDARRFRIHWSGDFFSVEYAEAWRIVIEENPDIKFFAYTRSFQPDVNVVPVLAGIENLDFFISVDCENVQQAADVLEAHPNIRVAYLVDYLEEAAELIETLGRREGFRSLACPENMRDEKGRRKLPVISSRGGACSRCTYCIDKPDYWDVIFVKTGLTYRAQAELPFSSEVRVELLPRKPRGEALARPVGAITLEAQYSLF